MDNSNNPIVDSNNSVVTGVCAITIAIVLCIAAALHSTQANAQLAVAEAASSDSRLKIVTLDRARQALQLAKLAATNNMPELSLRAVRESLAGGPPMQPIKFQRGQIASTNQNQNSQYKQYSAEIEKAINELNGLWVAKEFPPKDVYETLAAVVLPKRRPDEAFLYTKSLSTDFQPAEFQQPRSVGHVLANWAVKANQADNLKKRIIQRATSPKAIVESWTLMTQVELAANNSTGVETSLEKLSEVVKTSSLQHAMETACHAALPAMNQTETADSAIDLVENLVAKLPDSTSSQNYQAEPKSSLILAVAKARFKNGEDKKGLSLIDQFLSSNQKNNSRHSGDYGLYMRQHQLARATDELLAAKKVDAAFKYLGEAADLTTRYSYDPLAGGRATRLVGHLASLDSEACYKHLSEWCMPKESRRNLRHISSRAIAGSPPESFRKQQRPNADPKDPVDPIVSSASLLVSAAKECGKLDQLITDLKPFVDTEKTRHVLAMAHIANGDIASARPLVEKIRDEVKAATKKNDRKRDGWLDYVLAKAWSESTAKKHSYRRMLLSPLVSFTQKTQKTDILNEVRYSIARSHYLEKGLNPLDSFLRAQPALWTAGTVGHFNRRAEWISTNDHIKKNHGIGNDVLYFKYPLVGTFEFSAETLDDGWMESDITYGGIVAMNHSYQNTTYVYSPPGTRQLYRQKQPFSRTKTFVRKSIRVTPDSVTNLVNGHPVHTDKSSSGTASPWVGLFSTDYRAATYRNIRLTGDFAIPDEVQLSHDKRLRGWLAESGGRQPNPLAETDDQIWKEYSRSNQPAMWDWKDGEIIGKANDVTSRAISPAWLQYVRPLNNSENVTWEFFNEPGKFMAHPSLGHIAYELHNDAVKLRWFSTSENQPKHLVTIAEEQKGRVQLKDGWNQGRLAIENNTVMLSINGQPVYEHKLEPNEERKFGFYHDRNQSSARVRSVVLKGDWPTELTQDQIASLAAPIAKQRGFANGRVLAKGLGEKFLTRHSLDVVREASKLQPEERFQYLSNWVLTGDDHWMLRSVGDLTPAHPAPVVRDQFITSDHGGELVSPLTMLVDTGKQLGQLDALINNFKNAERYQGRAANAALVVAYLAKGDIESAQAAMHKMEDSLPRNKDMSAHLRWAELIACQRAVGHEELVRPVFHITSWLINKQISAGKEFNRGWGQHVRDLHSQATYRLIDIEPHQKSLKANKYWTPVSQATAESNGDGYPESQFRLSAANELIHDGGHLEDSMYFNVPLRGDFQVDCELTSFNSREFNLGYAGILIEPESSLDKIKVSAFKQSSNTKSISPKLNAGNWYQYRMTVKNDEMFCFINDREVYRTSLPKDRDPWLFVTSPRWCRGGIRNFRISGTPTIPKTISPLYDESMTGWSTQYYRDSMGPAPADQNVKNDWRYETDVKVLKAGKKLYADGAAVESLIQYHRPMLEDGTIQYRFTWKPGKQEVHPALGKCVFYLTNEKVRIHWLTDGRYDRTGLDPANFFDEPEHQLVDKLPFKEQGNELRLELKGDEVTIVLNDTPVFRRPMEAGNQRLFGFFRFKGQTMSQVRGMKWTGSWPTELPSASEQPFGGDALKTLLASLDGLDESFVCDFTKQTAKEIGIKGFNTKLSTPTAGGLKMTGLPTNNWAANGVVISKGVSGDFDITMEYSDLNMVAPETNASWLRLRMLPADARPIEIWGGLRYYAKGDLNLTFERVLKMADRSSVYEPQNELAPNSKSGRLRFIRVGGEVWFLFAAGKSDFRIIESYAMGPSDILPGQFHINVLSSHSKQPTTVTLKNLTIKADKIIE